MKLWGAILLLLGTDKYKMIFLTFGSCVILFLIYIVSEIYILLIISYLILLLNKVSDTKLYKDKNVIFNRIL